MTRPRRQRSNREKINKEAEAVGENINLGSINPDDIKLTTNNELVHEPTGVILEEDQIDRGAEWRAFNHSDREKKSRVGSPITNTRHDKGLITTIDWKNKDASGQKLSPEKRRHMHRLRKRQERSRMKNPGEQNLHFALNEIDRMASAIGVPQSVREVASVIYKRALNEDLIRGRSIEGVSTAVLYTACRKEGIPRSLEEVTEVSRVGRKEIGRTYRYITQELGFEMVPVDPKKYIPRFSSKLELSNEVRTKANEIIEITSKKGLLSGKSPSCFAAAAIYAASLLCDEKETQHEVAKAAQVTEVTIRKRYQEQIEAMEID